MSFLSVFLILEKKLFSQLRENAFTVKYNKILQKQLPTPADFKVPSNLVKHNLIVSRLMAAGSLASEAELVIASRKIAFNKALGEYKKENGQNLADPKKGPKNSKHVSSQLSQNGF